MHDFGPYHRLVHRYHTDLIELWGKAQEKWLTDKAKINELIKIVPRKYRIERFVFKKNDQKGIAQSMEKALKQGLWIGLRSSYLYQPLGKAPWIMALKTRRALRLFFEKRKKGEKKLWLGTPAHYDEWLADPGLKEIIVMFNPPSLCPQFACDHLVGRIEVFEKSLRMEMKLHSDQLRSMENGAERKDLIILNMSIKDSYRFEKRPVSISFGKNYLAPGKKQEAQKITQQVMKIVFGEWCQAPFNLYYRLQALREFGLGTLEIQGRMKNGKIDWFLVYGLRGIREVSKML